MSESAQREKETRKNQCRVCTRMACVCVCVHKWMKVRDLETFWGWPNGPRHHNYTFIMSFSGGGWGVVLNILQSLKLSWRYSEVCMNRGHSIEFLKWHRRCTLIRDIKIGDRLSVAGFKRLPSGGKLEERDGHTHSVCDLCVWHILCVTLWWSARVCVAMCP